MFINELIGEEYLQWKKGDVITITAGTGRGKSNFIKNELYEKAKNENEKILFFIHRSNTANQFELELEQDSKNDYITMKTYQSFQSSLLKQESIDLEKYKYIVCDEYHYFSNDSSFNKFTDVALHELLSYQKDSVLILMSATNGFINSYLEDKLNIQIKHYNIPISYEFVKSIDFYIQDAELFELLDYQLDNGIKTLVFMDSAKKSHSAFEKYKENSMFVCSEYNTTYSPKMDKKKRDELLKDQKYNDLFLFTTQTLDAGLNIVDDDLDCIIVDLGDIDTLIQCIGRKRLANDSDTIKLLVRNRTSVILADDFRRVKKKLKHAEYLLENGKEKYAKEFYREPDESQIVYYELNDEGYFEIKVNELAYSHLLYKQKMIDDIKEKPNGYMQFIEELFDKSDSLLHDRYLSSEASHLLSTYYEDKVKITGKKMKSEFAEKLELKRRNKVVTTITPINEVLERKQTPFRLVEVDIRKEGIPDKKAWMVKVMVKQFDGTYKLI